MSIYIKSLTIDERATWGTCPVCEAQHGEPCDMTAGIALGAPEELGNLGTHAARLWNAPKRAAISDDTGGNKDGATPNED